MILSVIGNMVEFGHLTLQHVAIPPPPNPHPPFIILFKQARAMHKCAVTKVADIVNITWCSLAGVPERARKMKMVLGWDWEILKSPHQICVIIVWFYFHACGLVVLTLKVLNFWKFTTYCSLKPLWSGMGEVVPARTWPTLDPPSPRTVYQLLWLAL